MPYRGTNDGRHQRPLSIYMHSSVCSPKTGFIRTHFTGPSLSIVSFVSSVSGVDARTHTSPVESLTAVDRPPQGKKPKRGNGLR